MSIKIEQVKVFKLTTGEELISITSGTLANDSHVLSYPMSTYPTQDGTYMFVPFCGIAETAQVVIPADKLVCEPLPIQEAFFVEYSKIVDAQKSVEAEQSAIAVPKSGIVIPK